MFGAPAHRRCDPSRGRRVRIERPLDDAARRKRPHVRVAQHEFGKAQRLL
jgi:hypothetical protein